MTNRREACFNMASDNTRKLMLSKVLNSARAANILDENDSDGVRGLIADYFATVPAVEREDAVDGEDESDQDDIEMVSESRRDVKTSNGDSEETAILNQAVGVLTIQKTPYLTMKVSLATLCHRFNLN